MIRNQLLGYQTCFWIASLTHFARYSTMLTSPPIFIRSFAELEFCLLLDGFNQHFHTQVHFSMHCHQLISSNSQLPILKSWGSQLWMQMCQQLCYGPLSFKLDIKCQKTAFKWVSFQAPYGSFYGRNLWPHSKETSTSLTMYSKPDQEFPLRSCSSQWEKFNASGEPKGTHAEFCFVCANLM